MHKQTYSDPLRLTEQLHAHLARMGYYVARHSTSMLVMKNNKIIITLHVYRDTCILKIHNHKTRAVDIANIIKETSIMTACKEVELVLIEI